MNGFADAPHRFRVWLSGSIRRKLTFFMVLICLLLVSLFWTMSMFLVQPSYNNLMRSDLTQTLKTVVAILDSAHAQGVVLTAETTVDGQAFVGMSNDANILLQQAQADGIVSLSGSCLDISNRSMESVWLSNHPLDYHCLLHPTYEAGVTNEGIEFAPERNSTLSTLVRIQVWQNGEYYHVLEDGQMIIGALAGGGQFAVIVSASATKVPQTVNVLKRLLLPISITLILFSVTSAWVFTAWFTRPINRLSHAAQEVSKGNYSVAVQPIGDDEIATLTRNFNVMTEEIKRTADLQKDLIANVSHDLRTPLTLIKGYAETVRDLTGDNKEKRTEQLNVIVDETDRLSALVNSVMEFSRMSSGTEKPEKVNFDLYQLCDEVGYRYAEYCRQKGLTFDFDGEENCYIYADPDLMERALHNLLGNALKHVGKDGYMGLHIHKMKPSNVARVKVIDHGPGVAEDEIPYLWDRYYRSRKNTGKSGTGLGLSITKAIFNAHGYEYGIQSVLDEGATFWFDATLVPPPKKPPAKKAAAKAPAQPDLKKEKKPKNTQKQPNKKTAWPTKKKKPTPPSPPDISG